MYYRYDTSTSKIVEKSETVLTGDNVVTYSEDLDIQLFDIFVGYVGQNGEMLKHTKIIRSAEEVSQKLSSLLEENKILSDSLTQTSSTLDTVLTELIPELMVLLPV